ncbi:putative antirepressor [Escherichia coli]|nr:putative antirepressor [Escherichia coli]SQR08205.1 putative antirepressor [Escherichia coli]
MLASLGGLVSCAAKVHFKEAGNAMNELIANHDFDFRQLVTVSTESFCWLKVFRLHMPGPLPSMKVPDQVR